MFHITLFSRGKPVNMSSIGDTSSYTVILLN